MSNGNYLVTMVTIITVYLTLHFQIPFKKVHILKNNFFIVHFIYRCKKVFSIFIKTKHLVDIIYNTIIQFFLVAH